MQLFKIAFFNCNIRNFSIMNDAYSHVALTRENIGSSCSNYVKEVKMSKA